MSKIKLIKKNQDESGITLVALVITIIILLILAGITLYTAVGENGLIFRARQAVERYKNAGEVEEEQLREIEKQLDNRNSIKSVIKVKGVDLENSDSPIGNWKFSICKDKECLEPLGIDIQVGDSGEADCSSLIKEAGTYYVGVTEPPENKDLPFKLFEFNVADIEEEQNLVIKFKGLSVPEAGGSYQGSFNGSDTPIDGTEFEHNINLQINLSDSVVISNEYNYSSNGKNFYLVDDSYSLAQKLNESDLTIDFYKIAEWDSSQNKIVIDDTFKDLNNVNTSELNTGFTCDPILTTRIKNIIRKNNLQPTGSYHYNENGQISKLDNGTQLKKKDFYLIVPHASDSDEFGRAYTDFYEVDFVPIIVSFVYSNEAGDSLYEFWLEIDGVNANNIFSNFKIVNNIANTSGGSFKTQDVIYEITAEHYGDIMYDDIIATECKNEGENIYTVDNLPIGLEYRIFPLYYGSQCYPTSESELIGEINTEEIEARFEFEYSDNNNKDISLLEYEIKYDDYYEQWEIESQNRDFINNKINIIDNQNDSERNSLKSIEIKNTDSTNKYFRFKILSSLYLEYYTSEGDSWLDNGDGYWYYSEPVSSNSTTGSLPFDISLSYYNGQPYTYNIVIMVESTNADEPNWE